MGVTLEKFVRLTNTIYDKGILLPESEVVEKIDDIDDWYQSQYFYNKEHFDNFQKTGTVKGITDVTADKIWWDLDCKADPEISRQDANTVVQRLKKDGVNPSDLEIYFSGSKGFHIILNVDRDLKPSEVQAIANKYAGDLAITFDTSVYNPSRVLRVPFTLHKKTNVFKIPVSVDDLKTKSIGYIKNSAKTLDNLDEIEIKSVSLPDSFYAVKTKPISNKPERDLGIYETPNDALKHRPKSWKDHKWLLSNGFFEDGERNSAMMVVASTYKALGYDEHDAYVLCKSSLQKREMRTGKSFNKEELVSTVIKTVFHESWNGGQYSIENNLWLKKYSERMGLDVDNEKSNGVVQIQDIAKSFKNFVVNIEENTVKTGIKWLDEKMPIVTGQNVGIVGAAGSGKTAIALELLKNTSQAGVVSVFASLDMHRNRLFEKLLYKASNQSREKIYEDFQNDNEASYIEKIQKDYGNVWFYDRSSPTVADIREYILDVQEKTGKRVKMVMVDYFERVNSDRSEDTAASKDVSGKLQDLVNDLDIALVTLVQPNKFSIGGGPDTPIKSYTAIKGSSFLYQSFRSIISIWRPFYTPEWQDKDNYMQMAILKNDLGEIGLETFGWTGKTGDIFELNQTQKELFEKLYGDKQNVEKEDKGKSNGWD